MDNNKDIVQQFQNILNIKHRAIPLALYNDATTKMQHENSTETTYTASDVIRNVSMQMKALTNSDCIKNNRSSSRNMNLYEKSTFLSVNNLQRHVDAQCCVSNANKFETQCISDTELVNFVQGIEAIDDHRGMTQEFDTTFCDAQNVEKNLQEAAGSSEEVELNSNQVEDINVVDISLKDSSNNKLFEVFNEYKHEDESLNKPSEELEGNSCMHHFLDDMQGSPILSIRSNKETGKPLIFDQKTFEEFEKIAMPIVEKHLDGNTERLLIQVQVDDRNLNITQSNIDNKEDVVNNFEEHSNNFDEDNRISKTNDVGNDEVLFSSDEEEEYKQTNHQDMPLTCALETSFYEQDQDFDKTMFVGFQTASNKSIQIQSDSFSKAKSIFDVVDKQSSETSLTELVEKCDNGIMSSESNINLDTNRNKVTNDNNKKIFEENIEVSSETSVELLKDLKPTDISDEDNTFVSQVLPINVTKKAKAKQVANNKTVSLSDMALKSANTILERMDFASKLKEKDTNVSESDRKIEKIRDKITDTIIRDRVPDINSTMVNNINQNESDLKETDIDFGDFKDMEFNTVDQNLEKIMFDGFEDLDMEVDELTEIESNANAGEAESSFEITKAVGFKTASNKEIKISPEALSLTEGVFQDIISKPYIMSVKQNLNEGNYVFAGFKTASNKHIDISNDAIAKSNKIFEDVMSDSLEMHDSVHFKGFQTASNKNIKISKEAIDNGKRIFKDFDKEEEIEICHKEEQINSNDNNEFLIGNDKTATITDQPKAQAKYVLDDVNKERLYNESERDHTTCLTNNKQNKISGKMLSGFGNEYTGDFFYGFQTASNKQILISDQALAQSKKIFRDLDSEISVEKADDKSVRNTFKGFQTASNKQINVSKEALAKSKHVFQDLERDISPLKLPISTVKSPDFRAIQTANYKQIKISEEALVKTRNIFQDLEQDISPLKLPISKVKSTEFKGFQTANNKQIKISEEVLAKTRNLFQDLKQDISPLKLPISTVKSTEFKGFKTANYKQIKISEEALAKTRNMFQDLEQDISPMKLPISTVKSTEFKGFQTANNKQIKISEEALAETRNIFQDLEQDISPMKLPISTVKSTEFKGFQTANNKQIKISEEALAKTRNIFQDLAEESGHVQNVDIQKESKREYGFIGFQSASKKTVNVSEKALIRSRKIFALLEQEDNVNNKSFCGFQTANNKEVKISEQALAQSKRIFEETDDLNIKTDLHANKPEHTGFQTASNKKIKISDEALAESKMLFETNEMDVATTDIHKATFKDFGFKSASNNKVEISEAALKLAKQIFTDKETPKQEVARDEEQNIENLIDTQIINNFEETMCSDVFKTKTPVASKRSGSPILSCPKSKRRKFEIPYSQKVRKPIEDPQSKNERNVIQKSKNAYTFDPNYKKNKIFNLKDLERMEIKSTVKEKVYIPTNNLNFDNLIQFEFTNERNDYSNTKFTITNVKELFLESTNKKFIPDGWLDNHIKLILWKLLSYEMKFPKVLNNVCTVRNLMEQLKFRYNKELYNAERPVLRKIMEKDDIASKTMVLCVVGMYEDGVFTMRASNTESKTLELLLTDGWYCIKASIDQMLVKLVRSGRIVTGCKLAISGAELVGTDQGVSPWEDTTSLRLNLSGNSTRLSRWSSRLGGARGAVRAALRSARQDGGRVATLRALVTRTYPAMYVERLADGNTVTRSERLEQIHQVKHESHRQNILERLYEEVEKEFSDQDTQDSEYREKGSKRCIETESQVQCHLTDSEKEALQERASRKRERLLQDIQSRVQEKIEKGGLNVNRNVVTLMKVRVADIEERGGNMEISRGMLSIWKPNEDILDIVKEGSWIEVTNVVPTAVRFSELQLSAGRQSIYCKSKQKPNEKIRSYELTLKRTCYPIKDLARNPTMSTEYNEIDTAGFIFLIDPSITEFDSTKHQFQNVYLANPDKNIICINFWGGLKKFGFENVLDTGQIIACTNLQKRAGNSRKNIPQYRCTELTKFTKTPRDEDARKIIGDLTKAFASVNKLKFCEDCTNLRNNFAALKFQGTENISPYRFNEVSKVFESPLVQKQPDFNLTGLDFESTFKQSTQDLSPKALLRKKQVKEKIEKLKRYGEPPPLSPLQIQNQSKRAGNPFKSPFSTSVASPVTVLPNSEKKSTDFIQSIQKNVETSPVLNRTYVKRNVNPVKLDFSSAENDVSDIIDHFKEDFDGSPPLSLE